MLFINQSVKSDAEVSEADLDARIKRFLVNNEYKSGDTEQLNKLFTNSINNLSYFDDIIKDDLLKIDNIVFSTLNDTAYNHFVKFINDLCNKHSVKLLSFNNCVFRDGIHLEDFVKSKSIKQINFRLLSNQAVFQRLNGHDTKMLDNYRQPHMIINTSTIPDNIKFIKVDFGKSAGHMGVDLNLLVPSSGLLIKIDNNSKRCKISYEYEISYDLNYRVQNVAIDVGKLIFQDNEIYYDVNMGIINDMYFDEIIAYCASYYNIINALTDCMMSDCLLYALERIKSYKIDLDKMLNIKFKRLDGSEDNVFCKSVSNELIFDEIDIDDHMGNFLYILNKMPAVNNSDITIKFLKCSKFDIGLIKLPENWNKNIKLNIRYLNDILKCNCTIKISENKDIQVDMYTSSNLLKDSNGNFIIIKKLENVDISEVPLLWELDDEYLLWHINRLINDCVLNVSKLLNHMERIEFLINNDKLKIEPDEKISFNLKSMRYGRLDSFINLFCAKYKVTNPLSIDFFMNYIDFYKYCKKNFIDHEKSKIAICIVDNSVKVNVELYSSLIDKNNLILKSEYDTSKMHLFDKLPDEIILWHLNKLIDGVRYERCRSFFSDDNMLNIERFINDDKLVINSDKGICIETNVHELYDNLYNFCKFIGLIADKYEVPLTFMNMDFEDNYNYFISQYKITDITNPKIESKPIKINKLILNNVRNFIIDCALIPDLNIQLDLESQRNCSIVNLGAHKTRIDLKELATGSTSYESGDYYIGGNTLYDKDGNQYNKWNSWLMDRDIGTCSNIEDNVKELCETYERACAQIKQLNLRIDAYDKCNNDYERMNLIKEVMFGDRLDNYKKCKDYNVKMAFIENIKSNAAYDLKMPSEIKYIESIFGVDNYGKLFKEFDKKIKEIDYESRKKVIDNYCKELKDTEKQNESNILGDNNLKILYGEIDKAFTLVNILLKNVTDIEYGAIDRVVTSADGSLRNEVEIEYNKEKITQYWSEYNEVMKINFNNTKVLLSDLRNIKYYDEFYCKDQILMDFVNNDYKKKIDSCLKMLRNINNILEFKAFINGAHSGDNIVNYLNSLIAKYSHGNIHCDELAFLGYECDLMNLRDMGEKIAKASRDFDFSDVNLSSLLNAARDKINNIILEANNVEYRNFIINCVEMAVVIFSAICGAYFYISSYVDSINSIDNGFGKFDDNEFNKDEFEDESYFEDPLNNGFYDDKSNDSINDDKSNDSINNDKSNDSINDDKSTDSINNDKSTDSINNDKSTDSINNDKSTDSINNDKSNDIVDDNKSNQ
jgi:hypothetical protein